MYKLSKDSLPLGSAFLEFPFVFFRTLGQKFPIVCIPLVILLSTCFFRATQCYCRACGVTGPGVLGAFVEGFFFPKGASNNILLDIIFFRETEEMKS